MTIIRHGFSVGIERINGQFFLSIKVSGKLTHEDFRKINPLVDSALDGITDPKVNVLLDGSEMEGWELRAAWDDFRFGLKHNNEFKRIAIFGHKKWQSVLTRMGSWFVSGEVKYFEDIELAIKWLES